MSFSFNNERFTLMVSEEPAAALALVHAHVYVEVFVVLDQDNLSQLLSDLVPEGDAVLLVALNDGFASSVLALPSALHRLH